MYASNEITQNALMLNGIYKLRLTAPRACLFIVAILWFRDYFPHERKKRERSRRDLSKVDDESFSCLVDFYDMHNVVRVFLRESLKRKEWKKKELTIYCANERDKPSTWG